MTDKLRAKMINAGRVLVDEGQGDYVWGHISARLPDDPGKFLMKPGCIGVEEMTEDNIITVNIEGDKVAGEWPRHNEVYIHSEVLRARPDVNCVIHTHGFYQSVLSTTGRPFEVFYDYAALFLGDVAYWKDDLDLTPDAEGDLMAETLGDRRVMLMGHHGALHVGDTLENAVVEALVFELCCRYQVAAMQVGGTPLDDRSAQAYRNAYLKYEIGRAHV